MDTLLCAIFAFLVQCGQPAPVPTNASPAIVAPSPTATSAPAPTPTSVPATATPTPVVKGLKLGPTTETGEIVRGNTNSGMVALTYDAGAGAKNTAAILDVLKAYGVKATLFLTGQWAEQNPELVVRMAADGHEFANHSYSHPEFTRLPAQTMISEIQKTEDIIKGITGKSTKPFFRPPFGDRDARVLRVVGEQGYYAIYWTLDSGDWREDYTAADVLNTVSNKSASGSIVVNHLDSWQTAQVLPQEIERLRARGLKIVQLSELLSE